MENKNKPSHRRSLVMLIGGAVFLFILLLVGVMGDDSNDSYDTNDFNTDGDVDYNDVEKHLNDSLEADQNDDDDY